MSVLRGAELPATSTVGDRYILTTTKTLYLCVVTNTWTFVTSGDDYFSALAGLDLADEGFSGVYADLTGKPTLGTAAATASGDYATAAQGTTANSAVQPARTVNGHALSANVTVAKGDVGLGSVDNTADTAKPVSTAQQTALNLKANLAGPTFTGTVTVPGVTISDATDLTISATTGTKFGQSGSKLGFFGVTPAVRPTALTQTYSTASATHANVTQLAAPAGGTGATAGAYDTAANRNLMIASVNAARTDIANIKQFVNQLVDQLQAVGLLQ